MKMRQAVITLSRYTTEVRYICETSAGLDESVGYSNIEQVLKNCLPKVFDFQFPIFDESYRSVIETKILRHYYTREIGFETVGLWKLKLNTKLNEIMPYYNKLYKSELIEFNPLYDVELTKERKVEGFGAKNTKNLENRDENSKTESTQDNNANIIENGNDRYTETNTADGTQNQNTNVNETNMYSDTPQGTITDLQSGKYLTNATVKGTTNTSAGASHDTSNKTNETTKNNTTETNGSVENNSKNEYSSRVDGASDTTLSNTEDYLEKVIGSNGGESFSKRLTEYRATFINIDMMIVNELEDLFFGLW